MNAVACPGCRLPLPEILWATESLTACPVCDRRVYVAVFPALNRTPAGTGVGEAILEDGVSSCFYHATKKAVVTCDGCGRFLCALCDLPFGERHVCSACLQSPQGSGPLGPLPLESQRMLWDRAAFWLALLPVLMWPFTLVTAPVAFACALYSLRRPTSLVSPSRWRIYLALLISLAEMVGWAVMFLRGMG